MVTLSSGLGALDEVRAEAAGAAELDWNSVADVEEVLVLTTNEDGTPRETTIWLAVVDGQGYIRTGGWTKWGDNVKRDPEIALLARARFECLVDDCVLEALA